MKYTINNSTSQIFVINYHSVPSYRNRPLRYHSVDILPMRKTSINISIQADYFFILEGDKSHIEFEILKSDQKFHVTNMRNLFCNLNKEGNELTITNE